MVWALLDPIERFGEDGTKAIGTIVLPPLRVSGGGTGEPFE
jgi:hypothetical protein